ncbi:MAG: DUF805 domain-containing protein [Pseudomonadota bacterium]
MSDTFEQVLAAAQAEGSLTAAWKKFVNTKFFVQVVRAADNDPKKATLHLARGPQSGAPVVHISEVRERLEQPHGATLATLSGADVVRMLHAEAAILVALSDSAFTIAKDRVDWLKKGIEAAQARAAAKAQQGAPAPAPAAVALTKPAPAPEAAPVRRVQGGVLDVAALKPRAVTLSQLGLEFFVPGSWHEIRSNRAIKFTDAASGSVVEASGLQRADLSLAQWQDMRMALVRHEMRYLVQDGEPYAIDGEGWRDRVKGMATEFTGTFPGDEHVSRYLLACIRIDGTAVMIGIRAPADAFEQNRNLYKWLLSRVDLVVNVPLEVQASAGRPGRTFDGDHDGPDTPAIFGMSLEGRITRLQALAYSFPVLLPITGAGILSAVVMPRNPVLGVGIMISALVVWLWLSMRLLVLRLHDANIGGKWILYYLGLALVTGIFRMPLLSTLIISVGLLAMTVVYALVPGSADDNDFGPPPAENSGWVKLGALLFVMLMFANGSGGAKYGNRFGNPLGMTNGDASQGEDAASETFRPYDRSFAVDMPGRPQEVPMPADAGAGLGGAEAHMYQLTAASGVYMAQSINYHNATLDHDASLRAIEQNLIGRDGTLIASRMILMNGLTGRDVRVALPNDLVRGSRIIISGSKILSVTIVTRAGEDGEAAMEAFLTSFTLP